MIGDKTEIEKKEYKTPSISQQGTTANSVLALGLVAAGAILALVGNWGKEDPFSLASLTEIQTHDSLEEMANTFVPEYIQVGNENL